VRGGFTTWTQGIADGGVAEVHVVELSSGRDRVVRRGHPQGSFLIAGPVVLWPESPRPDAPTRRRAADARTGRPFPLPRAFSKLRGVSGAATDGTALAYPNADFTSLWWSPSPSTTPRLLFATSNPASHIDNSVQVAGRYITFAVPRALYVGDTVTRRYVKVSAGGYARLDGGSLVLLRPSSGKAVHEISDVVFRPLASLPPIPLCR
jgi:hypothetical protein